MPALNSKSANTKPAKRISARKKSAKHGPEIERSVIRKLAIRKLAENKMQSACMAAAVVLTTVLLMTAFASVYYFGTGVRAAEMESAGWSAHGAIKDVTDEQYAAMERSNLISEISYYTHLGFMEESVQDEEIELQYSEDTIASWMYYGLEKGHMPKEENEIAVSSRFLESKGIDFTEGAPIHLRYSVNENVKEGDFVVSGIYEKKATSAEAAFVSREFCEKALEQASGERKMDLVMGIRVVEVLFKNTAHMERDMLALLSEAGISGTEASEAGARQNKWTLNPAYRTGSTSGTVPALALILVMIMSCGYFIIYNIYYISVMQDTRFYGSLATLGFRGYEIRRIVRHTTNLLCCISIPAGLALGFLFSLVLLPKLLGFIGFEGIQGFPNPLLFVAAAFFAYLTVRISSRKPAKLASKMSPIGARKFVAVRQGKPSRNERKARAQGQKKSGNARNVQAQRQGLSGNAQQAQGTKPSENGFKLPVMAWKNIARERNKTVLICCSFTACIILSGIFYAVSKGMDLEVFLADVISCDFIVGSRQYFNRVDDDYVPLDSGVIQTLGQWDGVQGGGGAHAAERVRVSLDVKAYKKYKKILDEANAYDYNRSGEMYVTAYGLDEFIWDKMEAMQGNLDWEKFRTGDYAIVNDMIESDGDESCYEPGDKLRLDLAGEKEYTVLAVARVPFDLTVRGQGYCSVNVYLPSQEWVERMQSEEYYMYAYDIEDAYEVQWESGLAGIKNESVSYESKTTFRDQFDAFANGILMLGLAVSIMLGGIGLLNFVNVTYSGIYDRKREIAVMQSMGMRRRQVYGMLVAEAGYYIFLSLFAGTALGLPLNYFIVSMLGRQMEFFRYHWHLQPYLVFGIAGSVLAVCVPCMIFHALDRKEDLLYRLRYGMR